jgi:hypothetical protein
MVVKPRTVKLQNGYALTVRHKHILHAFLNAIILPLVRQGRSWRALGIIPFDEKLFYRLRLSWDRELTEQIAQ